MTIQQVQNAPVRALPLAMPAAAPATAQDLYVASGPRPNRLWGVPVVAASTAASAGFGALSGLCVRWLGPWGIPAGIAAGTLLGGGTLGALSIAGDNSRKEAWKMARIGAAGGFGASAVGAAAAHFSSFPVIAGAAAGAVAGLAVASYLAFKD